MGKPRTPAPPSHGVEGRTHRQAGVGLASSSSLQKRSDRSTAWPQFALAAC
eukprot:CAMPEP_0198582366 /NCGR_PEP_ID=MMETSP1462-20131121/125422_1 /TAXON_ID=1333877 /ORGANISM="Brandtodinium nutriculum, Strain RCC3387" /LENGTH=50 /DNA_ID=CAMNT_0044313765 /DNA_START=1 /DNA_END=153 /DNA_ORIENTATION=-